MKNRIMIEVETAHPLHEYKEAYVIGREGQSGKYYAVTRRELFAPYLEEFEAMKKIIEEQNRIIENQQVIIDDYKKDMDKKYSDFLATYKETNSKILDMIKTFIKQGEIKK